MAEKQLIVAVEGTAAMGSYRQAVVSDYLDKIIGSLPLAEIVLLLLRIDRAGCLVQRSGWTRDIDLFLQWLSVVPFAGGGFNIAAVAEGLAEALMMFFIAANGSQTLQNVDGQRHSILVAASNPYLLPTPVY